MAEQPRRRTCGAALVHERLLRTVPEYQAARLRSENRAWQFARREAVFGRAGVTLIPVVVHVVYNTEAQNISEAQIRSQIDVLNQDFRMQNADIVSVPGVFRPLCADARIQFELASTDPHGAATNGITRTHTNVNGFEYDDKVKAAASGGADAWPGDRYLNIWVCELNLGLLGYTQPPGGPAATDGVVIVHSAFGTSGTAAAPFHRGRTATHEIGHWLNLRHIWGDDGASCSGDDFASDTPNQAAANYGTPTFPHVTCSNGPNGDLFMNYMDYVDDVAMFMFTNDQVLRMHACLDGDRAGIGNSLPIDRDGRLLVADFHDGQPPARVLYREYWGNNTVFDGWHDAGDLQFAGDFMGRGHAQLLSINRGGGGGRIMIADLSRGRPPAQVLYWEDWGNNRVFDGWHDEGDLQFVGDFMGRGHAQLLSINRGGGGGRIMIADFSKGAPPVQVPYWEDWGDNRVFDGWHDEGDLQFVGDFTGCAHAQLLSINRGGGGGRIMIADFTKGAPPVQVPYWEDWGNNRVFDGWHDEGDLQFVGDFMGRGHAQLLSINRGGGGGRIMIADFSKGAPPVQVPYWEDWGNNRVFDGWHDEGDLQFAGDFMGRGHAQLLSINRGGGGGRIMIADFSKGAPPVQVLYWENWGGRSHFDGLRDAGDLQFAGDFMGLGHAQLLSVSTQRPSDLALAVARQRLGEIA